MSRLFCLLCVALVSAPTLAQDSEPKFEVFTGYSYRGTRDRVIIPFQPITSGRDNTHGWALSFNYNFHKNIGVVADFAGQYGRDLSPRAWFYTGQPVPTDFHTFNTHQFLFGPQFRVRAGRVTEFAHALFGAYRAGGGVPGTHYAMGIGGGVDVRLTHRLSVRAFQADFIPVKEGYRWSDHVRLETGIVFRFGR